MMLIPCPFCGPRAHVEFTYERPLEAIVPVGAGETEAVSTLYQRDNPRGPSVELWRHTHGCRAWLTVERNTASHAIGAVTAVGTL
jgi:heterotetrameric sarcosine oxidase delta subunit